MEKVNNILKRITAELFGKKFIIFAEYDKKYSTCDEDGNTVGRIYLQVQYEAKCNSTGQIKTWNSGKHYLSEYMTEDEIVKKAWVAFESTIKHETMEAFKIDGVVLFNPHTNFEALLAVSNKEVKREPAKIKTGEGDQLIVGKWYRIRILDNVHYFKFNGELDWVGDPKGEGVYQNGKPSEDLNVGWAGVITEMTDDDYKLMTEKQKITYTMIENGN